MNVRFSADGIRCRVQREELDRLLSGRAIALELPLPRGHVFRASIRPSTIAGDRGGWQLESDPTGLWLTIPRAELEGLAEASPSKEGIARDFLLEHGGSVRISLEVDLRRRST